MTWVQAPAQEHEFFSSFKLIFLSIFWMHLYYILINWSQKFWVIDVKYRFISTNHQLIIAGNSKLHILLTISTKNWICFPTATFTDEGIQSTIPLPTRFLRGLCYDPWWAMALTVTFISTFSIFFALSALKFTAGTYFFRTTASLSLFIKAWLILVKFHFI